MFHRYRTNDEETRARLRLEVTESLRLIPDINGNLMLMTSKDKLAFLERCLPYLVTKFSEDQTLMLLNLTEETFSAVSGHPR